MSSIVDMGEVLLTVVAVIALLLTSPALSITVTVVTLPQQQKILSASNNFSSPRIPFYLPLRSEVLPPQLSTVNQPCPNRCACSHTTVICTGQDLIAAPRGIPQGTTRLDLQGNRISRITREDFVGLKALKILQLMDNRIETIDEGAFTDLVNLERLQLSRNHLRSLPRHLLISNTKLRRLDLSENYFPTIGDEHLEGPRDMLSLQLHHNQLRCMDHRRISSWRHLEVLSLNGNKLSTVGELGPFPAMRTMRLADNPWRCDCRLKWMKELKPSFSANVKCNGPAVLQGSPLLGVSNKRLKCSGIEKRALGSCRGEIACPSVCTCTKTTVDCRDRGLRRVPRSRDLPPSTRELRLEQNRIAFIPRDAFQNLANLTRLDISKNGIREIDEDAFRGLASLNTLMLFGNNLSELPAKVFSPLRHSLQLLLLNTNKLHCLQRDLFNGMERLALLSLYDNQIRRIPDGIFNFSSLETLHLAKNPLTCDCHLAWLEANLHTRQIETSGARCFAPSRLSRQRLGSIGADKFKCRGGAVHLDADEGTCGDVVAASRKNACIDKPCSNNGTCTAYGGGYKCFCINGWHGTKCEAPIDACYGAPCLNGATCKLKVVAEASDSTDGRFECHCTSGFTGDRCETNIDDCVGNKCRNGATCVDRANSYSCECPPGYSGEKCEKKTPFALALSLPANGSQVEGDGCSKDDCVNGACRQHVHQENDSSAKGWCECAHGYAGERCDEQVAVGFKSSGTFISVARWPADTPSALSSNTPTNATKQRRSLTMMLRTTVKSGVIAYYGGGRYYLAVELYAGRIKVAYSAGGVHVSHMYSYQTVDDGMPHRLQLVIEGEQVSMTLDNGRPQKIVNSGRIDNFIGDGDEGGTAVNDDQKRLYLGGLESSLARQALIGFHIKESSSFEGCLSAIHLNGQRVKLEDSNAVQKRGTLVGCTSAVDLCRGVTCSHRGTCVSGLSRSEGYRCSCQPDYHGPDCAEEVPIVGRRCVKRKTTEYHLEGECRSIEPLKMGRCVGRCDVGTGEGGVGECLRCTPVKTKRRRVKMQCGGGIIRLTTVDVVRKCACEKSTSDCSAATHPFANNNP